MYFIWIPVFLCFGEIHGCILVHSICMWKTEISQGCSLGSHSQDLSVACNVTVWYSGCMGRLGILMPLHPEWLTTSTCYHTNPNIKYVFLLIIYVKWQLRVRKGHHYDAFNKQQILVFPWSYYGKKHFSWKIIFSYLK